MDIDLLSGVTSKENFMKRLNLNLFQVDYPLEDTSSFLSSSDFDQQCTDPGLLLDELGTLSPKLEKEEEQSPLPAATRSSVIVHYGPSSPQQAGNSPLPAKALPCNSPAPTLAPTSPPLMANSNPSPILVAGSPPQRSPTSLLAGPAPALQVGYRIVRTSLKLSFPGGDRTKACACSTGGCDKPEEGDGGHRGEAGDGNDHCGKAGDLGARRQEARGACLCRCRCT